MEALYQRVLTHVPTRELHKSYNAVLHEEFASASQALDDVLAAFAKLEEVRDAVSKLQQSHESSSGGHSTSTLMASAGGTMTMQQQLEHQVKELAVGMRVEGKRKREEDEKSTLPSANPGSHSFRTAKETRMSDAGVHLDVEEMERYTLKSKREESNGSSVATREVAETSSYDLGSSFEAESDGGGEEESDEVEDSEVYWKALATKEKLCVPSTEVKSEVEPANVARKSHTSASTQVLKKSATYMKAIVKEVIRMSPMNRWFVMPELLAALKEAVEEDVGGTQQSEVAYFLEVLINWGTHQKEYQALYAGMYREYAAAVDLYVDRIPGSEQKSELKRLKETLSSTIEAFDGLVMDNENVAIRVAAIQKAKRKDKISTIGHPESVRPKHRIGRLLGLLVAFKKQTATSVHSTFGDRLVKVIRKLPAWLNEDPVRLRVLRMILCAFRDFSGRIPDVSTRNRVLGLVDKMLLEDISVPSNARFHARLSELRSRATQVLAKVQQYQGQAILTGEARGLIYAVESLVKVVAVGWNPRKDPTVRQCVKVLKNIFVQSQNSYGNPRNIPISKVWKADFARWKIEESPEQVHAEIGIGDSS